MPEVFSIEKRSEVMSRIRGRGYEETEVPLARMLRAAGITGWRRHTALVGRPDFAFRRERVVVFVDGCFWHGCPRHSNMPANNRAFWMKKLEGNRARDRVVARTLRKAGWRDFRVWEHELRNPVRVVARIRRALVLGTGNRG